MSLADILAKYESPSTAPIGQVEEHFDQVATEARPEDLNKGLAAALRSNATPDFGSTVGSLFARSNPQQRAGVLNQLIQSLGAGGLSGLADGVLGRILGNRGVASTPPSLTPGEASQLAPADVTAIAAHAQSRDESVIDKISSFYSQHPALVKSIGAAGLAILMGQMRSNA